MTHAVPAGRESERMKPASPADFPIADRIVL
jgi:hypothetical protein